MTDTAEHRKMKPKRTYKATETEPSPLDRCGTPSYALDPLLKFIPKQWKIWEPAMGDGRMVRNLQRFGYDVLGSGIEQGHNFFSTECENADVHITNPPYGIKFQWIERCYELVQRFALLVPVETIGSGKAQRLMDKYGAEILLLDKRVNFYMPNKGNAGSAQFPVLWLCWNILPAPICYGQIVRYPEPEE